MKIIEAAKEIEKTPDELALIAKENEYKIKYGVIGKVENKDANGNPIVCYFKKPSRLVLGVAMAEIDRNFLLACEYIYDDACVREISDYEAFRNDDELFIGINGFLQGLIRGKKSLYTTL